MNRFDIGVIVVTFVALGLIALIRNVVAPIVRYRIARRRIALQSMAPPAIAEADGHDLELGDGTR